ncbi:MAG: hypothetical protein A3E36_02325 [Candidatus Andersenbacteria bacterium RIFCSPHIGHO2_12_FULL_45_11b]|uniref:Uncharacterized protein n=1 Tax=Candidatus Andersenbacteria bacterium RIFCSPHIGHO2_12_FULL_45_11b TaxID=1797282 RepID=A0A1G1XDB6_9BACT|nr:MAG: hypothetical protein A3E36_02325 [Candidatus Andersenbacteria bacterium RIFCSPHIGHO2_12_FULL_45_11b]
MRLKGISEKLTLDEAQNIVRVWGTHLEHSGGLMFLFGTSIPESLLPYPIDILQGAINKMEAFYYGKGLHDKVRLLEETEMSLTTYVSDEEAIDKFISSFSNSEFRKLMVEGLQDTQKNQAQNGFLVDGKLWELSKARIEELEQ